MCFILLRLAIPFIVKIDTVSWCWVDNICTISDQKPLAKCDDVSYNDIVERNVHFFDQYSGLIILYLIRVTVELAHVKKIEI